MCPTSNSKRKPSIICVVFHTGTKEQAPWRTLQNQAGLHIVMCETSLKLRICSGSVIISLTPSLTFDLSVMFLRLSASRSDGNSAQFHCHVSKMSNLMYGRQKEANAVFKKLNVNVVITIRQRSKHGRQQLVAEWCAQRFLSPLVFKLPYLFERKALNH